MLDDRKRPGARGRAKEVVTGVENFLRRKKHTVGLAPWPVSRANASARINGRGSRRGVPFLSSISETTSRFSLSEGPSLLCHRKTYRRRTRRGPNRSEMRA